MVSEPSLVRYACVAHQSGGVGPAPPTILAEYNPGESSLQSLAQECLLRTPANHLIFSHTVRSCAYTFLIDDLFVYFAVSDEKLSKSDRIWFLSRLKDTAQHLIAKQSKSILKSNRSLSSYCLQNQMNPLFDQLLSNNGADGFPSPNPDGLKVDGDGSLAGIACKVQSRGKRIFAVPLLLKKKKRLLGETGVEGNEMLVEDKVELSDRGEAATREALVCHPKGVCAVGEVTSRGVCLSDGSNGGKQKAKKVWRRHVWVVLALDLAVCMILFGIWLMVCHGFECIDR